MAAGAGVDQLTMALAWLTGARQCLRDVLARAATGVGAALRDELLQRCRVQRAACRLVQRRFVRLQTAGGQLRENGLVCTGHTTRCVHVFHAHQPAPAVGACVQPAGQSSHQRSGMQRAGG